MPELFIPFLATLIAELGDKSFLTVTYLSSRTKKHGLIFTGAISAYIVINSITAFAGSSLTQYVDQDILKVIAGGVFILFGLKALLSKEKKEKTELKASNLFRTSFGLILLTEIGDRTNIATGLFATQYNPLIVLLGVISALALVTLLAIQVGKWMSQRISHDLVAKIGGGIFVIIGIFLIFL